MSFWWRRWIEQSRSPRWTTWPCASASTWISTWRGSGDVLLDVDGGVAEGGLGLVLRLAHGGGKGIRIVHDADALAAAPAEALTMTGRPIAAHDLLGGGGVGDDAVGAGRDRHAGGRHRRPRRRLVAHQLDRLGTRPDERDAVRRRTDARSAAFSARKP